MNTNLTGQTVIAVPSCVTSQVVTAPFGLGLHGTGVSGAVSGSGINGLGGNGTRGTSIETGLSLGWTTFGGGRGLRSERPLQASKAIQVDAEHGVYVAAVDAGAQQKQDEKQIKAEAALAGAEAVRMWAFRGPEPWRDRA
ncbi:hypothetical protein ACIRBX_21000 [Kitasatospora sp. NPDC096147]|uniref:hypothetical protein n=1 Tax=Kitasatospora sp. NPDC096147 TaxID=3364093 RepID=UPI0037FB6530